MRFTLKSSAKYPILIGALVLLTGLGVKKFVLDDKDPVYKPQKLDTKTLARMPVEALLSNIKNGRWHLLSESFSNEDAFNDFKSEFFIDAKDQAGVLGKASFIFKTTSAVPDSKDELADCLIALTVYLRNNSADPITIECETSYDNVGKQYLIDDIDFSKQIKISDLNLGNGTLPEIPPISASPCSPESESSFTYVRPKFRLNESAPVQPNVVLGPNPNEEFETIPADFYGTNAIKQEPFEDFTFTFENPKYTACRKISPKFICDELFDKNITRTYNPGYMVSQQDVINNEMTGVLFSFIKDAEGVLQVSKSGQLVPYPAGFFLDAGFKRLTALTSKNEIIHYGTSEDHYHFNNPIALTVAGNFIYVLDGVSQKTTAIFKYFLNSSNDLQFEFKGTTDFGIDLSYAVDLSGYRGEDNNVMYVFNKNTESITRFELDAETGLVAEESSPKEFRRYQTLSGQSFNLRGIEKIKVSPRSGDGKDIILAIQNYNQVISFSTQSDGILQMNFKYDMPFESRPVSIGYNLGNNTFIVSDLYANKIHMFSNSGAYLGAGGKPGVAEDQNELFQPAIVSSNNFANDALEFIVANNTWGLDKGFKRFFPQADIGKIEVIEKMPTGSANTENNEVIFRYTLTASNQVNKVVLRLNGQPIKTITGPFYPDILAENFSATQVGEDGIKDKLNVGWNTYEVELTATIPGPSSGNLQFKRIKSLQFYFLPSVLDDSNLVIDNAGPSTDYPHSKTDPFYIYKNTVISGPGQFKIANGKMVLAKGCTLKIAKERQLLISNEDLEFECGANLEIYTTHDIPKLVVNSNFNGLLFNYNMVSTRGDYTGGVGSGSAPSSMLEFITCKFENYLGKALHVIEGRATVVNSSFQPNIAQNQNAGFATAVGIVVDPGARLDVRGGSFYQNHIGIDGNNAQMSIGRHGSTYKGVHLADPLFDSNEIGIHAFNSNTEIKNSNFKNSVAAIVDLNGSVDLANNSENTFEKNKQAVIFSKQVDGRNGGNRFVDNNVDVTYILPAGTITPASFGFECNYWQHGTVYGSPVIDVVADPPYDHASGLITFIVTPYMVKKGNNYTCTGKNGRAPTFEELTANTPQDFQVFYNDFLKSLVGKADHYNALSKVISERNQPITIGSFPEQNNLSLTYEHAMVKNSLFTYLYRSNRPEILPLNHTSYGQAYSYLSSSDIQPDHFVEITRDRTAFAQFFIKDPRKVLPPELASIEMVTVTNIIPNPTMGRATIRILPPTEGIYSISILNSSGRLIKSVSENTQFENTQARDFDVDLTELPAGMYFVRLQNNVTQWYKAAKFIKK